MGLPGHRRTSGDKRRNHNNLALTSASISHCLKCGKPVLPHRACAFCGTYRGRQVINVDKKAARAKKS